MEAHGFEQLNLAISRFYCRLNDILLPSKISRQRTGIYTYTNRDCFVFGLCCDLADFPIGTYIAWIYADFRYWEVHASERYAPIEMNIGHDRHRRKACKYTKRFRRGYFRYCKTDNVTSQILKARKLFKDGQKLRFFGR
ncbi:MAG: hypothetical protein BWX44_00979 [Spirochaetes bacterium ADurb.Bin001]|nr:MAG: hypothetical protein BWX44_00979 [Spirochaetes bacterium ADurb.Bin001]